MEPIIQEQWAAMRERARPHITDAQYDLLDSNRLTTKFFWDYMNICHILGYEVALLDVKPIYLGYALPSWEEPWGDDPSEGAQCLLPDYAREMAGSMQDALLHPERIAPDAVE